MWPITAFVILRGHTTKSPAYQERWALAHAAPNIPQISSVSFQKKRWAWEERWKGLGLYSAILCASLHKQMAKQDTSARKGKAESGKECGGNQACSTVIYFYSCTGNFSCWLLWQATPCHPFWAERKERRGAKWDPSVYSVTSPPGASSIQNVMFEYLLCFV